MAAAYKRTLRPNRAATVFPIQPAAYAVGVAAQHDIAYSIIYPEQTKTSNHSVGRPGGIVGQHFDKGGNVGREDRSPFLAAAVAAFAVCQMSGCKFVESVHQIRYRGLRIQDPDIAAQYVAQKRVFGVY